MNILKYKAFKSIVLLILISVSLITTIASASTSIKIAIDPGHGGYDPGVVYKGIVEKQVCLDISKRLELYLKQYGYRIVMTRNTDKSLYRSSKAGNTLKLRDLNERVNVIDKSNAKLFISIHVNSNIHNKKAAGPIVYYYFKSKKSKALALVIQKSLNNLSNKRIPKNDPRPADFYILKNTKAPGVLIETGFITNKHDRYLFKTRKYKRKISLEIARGVRNSIKQEKLYRKKDNKLSTSVKHTKKHKSLSKVNKKDHQK